MSNVISGGASPCRTTQESIPYGRALGRQIDRQTSEWVEGVADLDDEFHEEEVRAVIHGNSRIATATTWEQREREFRRSRPSLFLLLIAMGNLVVVHSELVCYLILIINHMRSANVLSLVYPLMVFLWGMLSVPRPTKTFWISLITYTEVSRFPVGFIPVALISLRELYSCIGLDKVLDFDPGKPMLFIVLRGFSKWLKLTAVRK